MKSVRLLLVFGIAVIGLAYLVFSTSSQRPHGSPTGSHAQANNAAADLVIREPIAFRNLTIFPVSARTPRVDDRFITLDEGLKDGTIEIFEKGAAPADAASGEQPSPPTNDPFAVPPTPPTDDPFAAPNRSANLQQEAAINAAPSVPRSNSVNELVVVNHSNKALYLMPGEIVIGGSQDRTVGQELVIAPDGKPVSINVFCVEHGRWGGRDARAYAGIMAATPARASVNVNTAGAAIADLAQAVRGGRADSWDDVGGPGAIDTFQGNLSLVVSETTEVANKGKFIGSIGSLNKAARVAVQSGEGQGKVWEQVAEENAKAGVTAQSGTFSGNYAENQSAERLTAYLDHLTAPVAETENVVGVIVAVNGEVESIDVFESTPLFRKLWPKLLKSYALDAANAAAAPEAEKQASGDDARKFLDKVTHLKSTRSDAGGELATLRADSDDVIAFAAHDRRSEQPSAPNAHGTFGGGIHSSAFAK